MSLIRMKAFSGPTQHLTLRHPFATRRTIFREGVPIGIDVFSGELICFDPAWLKDQGFIDSMMFAFFGIKGFGKSATLKIIALRYAMMTAGFEELRVAVNDHKVLKQERQDGSMASGMEYDALAQLMGCVPFVMSKMRVNPFDPRICTTLSQLLAMASLLAGFSSVDQLNARTKRALRVATFRMYGMGQDLWSPRVLLECVRTLCVEDVIEYHRLAREVLKQEQKQRMERLSGSLKDEITLAEIEREFNRLLDRDVTVSDAATLDAKESLFDLLDDLLSGPDAELFGDSHGMHDMYSQRASVRQWTGFASGGMGETIMRTLDAQLRTFAIENGQMDLLAHLELDDERHRSIDNFINAKTSAYFSKIARSLPITNLSATQRLNDLRRGTVGSEHYNLGQSIIDDLGGVLIARQRGDKATLDEYQERYVLTNSQRAMLPRLPKYTMFFKASEEFPPSLMRVFATEAELPYLKTDQSNRQLLTRPGVGDLAAMEEYARVNGVKMIGRI